MMVSTPKPRERRLEWSGFRDKDKFENYLHRMVCAGSISLSDAQPRSRPNGSSTGAPLANQPDDLASAVPSERHRSDVRNWATDATGVSISLCFYRLVAVKRPFENDPHMPVPAYVPVMVVFDTVAEPFTVIEQN